MFAVTPYQHSSQREMHWHFHDSSQHS